MADKKQLQPPDFTAVLDELKQGILKSINCVQVGIVQDFDKDDQTATIQMSIKKVVSEDDNGNRILEDRPLLIKVPVIILSGGPAYLTFPIASGDECLVLFNDREIDNWYLTGEVKAPTSARLHDLSDGLALVGVRSLQNLIDGYLENGARLAYGENTQIDLLLAAMNSKAALWTHTGNFLLSGFFTMLAGAAPGAPADDTFQFYGADIVAGNNAPHFKTENGEIIKLFRQANIADPTGGVTVDTQARTAINAILDILENNGLMGA